MSVGNRVYIIEGDGITPVAQKISTTSSSARGRHFAPIPAGR